MTLGGVACAAPPYLIFVLKENTMKKLQILELFGGIGAPRVALNNLGVPVKAIDYVEIDQSAVNSYNAMFENELAYRTQDVRGYNLRPDILIHGSPCQSLSIAGHTGKATAEAGRINRGAGADKGSGTVSSLMWETVNIINQMGAWKPKVVIWENVKNLLSKVMIHNFKEYLETMEDMGYTNSYRVLDARNFGLPQARERCFTVSILGDKPFDFDTMEERRMKEISLFLEDNRHIPPKYIVNQPSILEIIGEKGIRRATVIKDYAYTITTRQDRAPAQVIDMGNGKYRFLTEKECWRLQGYSDEEFEAAESSCLTAKDKMNRTLYKQAGNSIPVTIFEAMFEALLPVIGCEDLLNKNFRTDSEITQIEEGQLTLI